MKATPQQLNAATLAYDFGRQWAILYPDKKFPTNEHCDKLIDLLFPYARTIPGMVRERFRIAMQNGWMMQIGLTQRSLKTLQRHEKLYGPAFGPAFGPVPPAKERRATPVQSPETREVVGLLRKHGVEVNDGRPTKNKITPSTAIGLTG
jgi:hypothetical protein